METTNWFRTPGDAVDHFLRPGGLCVVEGHRANATRQALLARLERAPEIPMLMAPATHQRMSRVLVVHDRHDPGASFLESAVRLCQALEIQPLILTLASSERGALLKQRVAEGVCARLDLPADFDAAVSLGVRAAVDRAARWRNCSHVFFERTNGATGIRLWQRPLDILSQWRGISDSLALLALPAGLTLDFPKKTYSGRFGRFWNSPGSAATKLASTNGTNASEVTRDKP